ncbi:hypothetical protein F2Q70_00008246 [Brassica cretica]|uniref:Uncharacterized protein n=1 Tax=Brassica cretica TaxID=69181 RepID=A0A8S9M5B0_BRACR|nr:hypothetical protein F2Q70_00008246 [Brassica cretica]
MKSSVKSGRISMEDQRFDTQRHLAIDFAGSLKRSSKMRSAGIGSEFSLPLVEIGDRELHREMVGPSSNERFSRRDFMAEMLALNPRLPNDGDDNSLYTAMGRVENNK